MAKKQFGIERKVTVSARAYAAAMLAQSTEQTRYYLNGVCVEPAADGGVNLVATNGHIIIAIHDPEGEANGKWICPVPAQMRKFLLANLEPVEDPDEDEYGGFTDPRLVLRTIRFDGLIASVYSPVHAWKENDDEEVSMAATAEAIDGTFPDWYRVLPRPDTETPSIPSITVAVRYMRDLARAVAVYKDSVTTGVRLRPIDKAGPMLIGCYDDGDFIMCAMPMRDDGEPVAVPAWVPDVPAKDAA